MSKDGSLFAIGTSDEYSTVYLHNTITGDNEANNRSNFKSYANTRCGGHCNESYVAGMFAFYSATDTPSNYYGFRTIL